MGDNLMVVFNVFIVFGSILMVIKIISENRLRQRLIEKGQVDENSKLLISKPASEWLTGLNAVKWGMVLIGIGLAVIGGRFFDYQYQDEISWGLALIFSGVAFLIYYSMYKKAESENK